MWFELPSWTSHLRMLRCPGHLGVLEFRDGSLEVSFPRARTCLSHRLGGRMERIGWMERNGFQIGWGGEQAGAKAWGPKPCWGVCSWEWLWRVGACAGEAGRAHGVRSLCVLLRGLAWPALCSVTCCTFRRWSLDLGPDSSTTITEFCHSPLFAAVRRGVILAPVPSFQRAGWVRHSAQGLRVMDRHQLLCWGPLRTCWTPQVARRTRQDSTRGPTWYSSAVGTCLVQGAERVPPCPISDTPMPERPGL